MITCGTQVVSGSTGGGGASLPAAPADALLDAGNPSTMLGLDASGVGEALSASAARSRMGLGSLATQSGTFSGTSSGTNTGDQTLTSLGVSAFAQTMLDDADAATTRATLGLGDAASASIGTSPGTVASGPAATWPGLYGATLFGVGGSAINGFTTADHVAQATASAIPALGPGQSFVIIFYPRAVPAGAQYFAAHTSGGKGFLIGAGSNAGARSRCSLVLAGLNGSADIYFTGSDFAALLDVPMVIACTILADKSVHYSVNGGAVVTVAALSGSYAAPAAGDTYYIGYPAVATTSLVVAMNTYSTEISDADLVAACANVAAGTIPTVASGTISTKFAASDFCGGLRMKTTTGLTWLMKGDASLRPI